MVVTGKAVEDGCVIREKFEVRFVIVTPGRDFPLNRYCMKESGLIRVATTVHCDPGGSIFQRT